MTFNKKILINSIVFILICTSLSFCQSDSIVFQETDLLQTPGTQNTERKPIFKPDVCAQNELLYPGDKDDDWVCDCIPGYVYHPDYDQCYPLYRKEPCQNGEYLVLGRSKIPECAVNPCRKNNQVRFQGRCYDLGKVGPCRNRLTAEVVEVNETTLEIGCVAQRAKIVTSSVLTRFSDPLELKSCTDGTKKNVDICKTQNIQYWLSPETCGIEKVLYKMPGADDRICDCTPGYIYDSATDNCYLAHSKGPCQSNEKFVLQGNVGLCTSNECPLGQTLYSNACVDIEKKGPCANGEIISADAYSYEVSCVQEVEPEAPGKFFNDIPQCTKGGKRDKENKC